MRIDSTKTLSRIFHPKGGSKYHLVSRPPTGPAGRRPPWSVRIQSRSSKPGQKGPIRESVRKNEVLCCVFAMQKKTRTHRNHCFSRIWGVYVNAAVCSRENTRNSGKYPLRFYEKRGSLLLGRWGSCRGREAEGLHETHVLKLWGEVLGWGRGITIACQSSGREKTNEHKHLVGLSRVWAGGR